MPFFVGRWRLDGGIRADTHNKTQGKANEDTTSEKEDIQHQHARNNNTKWEEQRRRRHKAKEEAVRRKKKKEAECEQASIKSTATRVIIISNSGIVINRESEIDMRSSSSRRKREIGRRKLIKKLGSE